MTNNDLAEFLGRMIGIVENPSQRIREDITRIRRVCLDDPRGSFAARSMRAPSSRSPNSPDVAASLPCDLPPEAVARENHRFSADRTVMDYTLKNYVPALGTSSDMSQTG